MAAQLVVGVGEVLAPLRQLRVDHPEAVQLQAEGHELLYVFDANAERTGVPSLLRAMSDLGVGFKDLNTKQSSLEDIFVSLVSERGRPQ